MAHRMSHPYDERMPAIEFKAVREALGLDHAWIATQLGLSSDRQVRRWEAGDAPIPDGVREQIESWEEDTVESVARSVTALIDLPNPVLMLPREGIHDGWPARWHRHVAIRVADQVPGLMFTEHKR